MKKMCISVAEAAEMLSIGKTALDRYIKSGKIQAYKSGSRTLVLVSDIENFVNMLPVVPTEKAPRPVRAESISETPPLPASWDGLDVRRPHTECILLRAPEGFKAAVGEVAAREGLSLSAYLRRLALLDVERRQDA